MHTEEERVEVSAVYLRVQAMPYATDAAFDASGLREQHRGNCVAKSALLAEELEGLGLEVRHARWEYELPRLLEVQEHLAFRTDIHSAVEVRLRDRWILVDATHDPPLSRLGLTVGAWDGTSSTATAYPPIGPVLHPGDPADRAILGTISSTIAREVEGTPPELIDRYRDQLNRLFDATRDQSDAARDA